MAAFYDSDSDQSDFSGFSPSDIDVSSDELFSESDDDVEVANPDNEWTSDFTRPTIGQFTAEPGPNLPDTWDPATSTPLDYFLLLFPMELIRFIVIQTNNYAAWIMSQPGEDVDDKWYDVTVEEMRAFLGINILMGINQLPEADMYWSGNQLIGNLSVAATMTCNRYQRIMRYLHVSDREAEPARGSPDYDRLYKIRPVLEQLSDTFEHRYTLSREVSIDEAMIAFSGRLSFRQYMPAKPIKRGIKVWMLCDANNAYLSRFDVYLGRRNGQIHHGLGHDVVMKLSDNLQHSNRHLYFDNFFTGVPLMEQLLEVGLYACGTVRANRKGFPSDLKKPAGVRDRGAFKILQKGNSNLTASVWRDKKLVHHLSTLSDPQDIVAAQRRSGACVLHLNQPHSVSVYNRFMGGVDLHDQFRAKYDVGRKGKKAWRYLFWFLLNCSIVNAFLLYKAASTRLTKKKRYANVDFRLELISQLIGGYRKRKRPTAEPLLMPLIEAENLQGHVSCRMPGTRKVCKYHSRVLKERKETVYGCSTCSVHLCRDGCHAQFHNMG